MVRFGLTGLMFPILALASCATANIGEIASRTSCDSFFDVYFSSTADEERSRELYQSDKEIIENKLSGGGYTDLQLLEEVDCDGVGVYRYRALANGDQVINVFVRSEVLSFSDIQARNTNNVTYTWSPIVGALFSEPQ